jgi:hypothetical protein
MTTILIALSLMTCVSMPTTSPEPPALLEQTTLRGWQAMDENGNHWQYRTEEGIVATCVYTYMKVGVVQMWRGTYYHKKTDFMEDGPYQQGGLGNLVGCVVWVYHNLYGDYWI